MIDRQGSVGVSLMKLPGAEDLPSPAYMSSGAVGLDLPAAVTEPKTLAPGEFATVPTGLAVAIPEGYEGQVRPRSGLAARHGISLVNAPGTIDPDYRGEIRVIVINLGREPFTIQRGERIAQLVIAPALQVRLEIVTQLPSTVRGEGGFGHTGR